MNKLLLILGIIIIIFTPFIINWFVTCKHFSNGSIPDWINFFSNYIGAIIGGFVAFFAARYQIDKQNKNENIKRLFEQLPYYVKLKYILENIKIILLSAKKYKTEVLPDILTNGNGKMKFDFNTTVQIPFHINQDEFLITEKILDPDFNSRLVELFYYYKDFSEIVSFNINELRAEMKKYEIDLSILNSKPEYNNLGQKEKLESDYFNIKFNISAMASRKELIWNDLINKNYYELSESLLKEVITTIDQLKIIKV